MQQHRTMCLTIDTCAAGDGERTIGAIIEIWPFYCDIAAIEENRPETLPFGLAGGDCAGALPVIMPDLLRVRCIEHRIVKAKNIAERQLRWVPFLNRIGDGVFNDVDCLNVVRMGRWAAMQQIG